MQRPIVFVTLALFWVIPLTGESCVNAQETIIQTPPNRGGTTLSMGLPPSWRWSLGGTTGVHRLDGNDLTFYLNGGLYKDFLLAPVTHALGLLFEGYVGRRGSFEQAGESFGGLTCIGDCDDISIGQPA